MNKKEKLNLIKNKNYKNIDKIFNDIEIDTYELLWQDYIYIVVSSLLSIVLGLVVIALIPILNMFILLILFSEAQGRIFIFLILFSIFYTIFLFKEKKKKQMNSEINSVLLKKTNEMHPLESVSDIHEYKKVFLSQKT